MANQPREQERRETNGIAKDLHLESAARQLESHPTWQGYLMLGVGTILTLFSLGFFPILKWVIFASGIALAVWGAAKSHIIETIGNFFESFHKKM